MNVLHDWDEIPLRVDWARRRGISLILYSLANKFPILKKIKFIGLNSKNIENEKLLFMNTLIKLDIIAGVISIFGIRDEVMNKYNDDIYALEHLYNLDVRKHIHIGDPPDPNRIRLWIPPINLNVPMHFDTEYRKGNRNKANKDEIAVFHVDYPYHLASYIDYLFEVLKDG